MTTPTFPARLAPLSAASLSWPSSASTASKQHWLYASSQQVCQRRSSSLGSQHWRWPQSGRGRHVYRSISAAGARAAEKPAARRCCCWLYVCSLVAVTWACVVVQATSQATDRRTDRQTNWHSYCSAYYARPRPESTIVKFSKVPLLFCFLLPVCGEICCVIQQNFASGNTTMNILINTG